VKVLVVDDSRTIRMHLRDTLTAAGIEVVEASDGLEAIQTLAREPVDLVLCDINMPRLNGLAFAEHLRLKPDYASLPVMFLTSEARPDLMDRARKAGAKGWLVKPVRSDILLNAVRRVESGQGPSEMPGPPSRPKE
jgi:two-component system chemotaxis response regulator CheY